MIGQTVHSRANTPVVSIVLGFGGCSLLNLAYFLANWHLAILAVLPLALAVALWPRQSGSFSVLVTHTGLRLESPVVDVPYAAIKELTINGLFFNREPDRIPSGPIRIVHEGGVLDVPERLNVPANEFYHFLLQRTGAPRPVLLTPALVEFFNEQQAQFGADRVWAFTARDPAEPGGGSPRATAFFFAVTGTGIIWCTAGGLLGHDYRMWIGIGVLASIVGLFCWLLCLASKSQTRQAKKNAGLFISPIGIAMVQGDLRGRLRWDEIRQVVFKSPTKGIRIRVEGSEIKIANVYRQSLDDIHSKITGYWR